MLQAVLFDFNGVILDDERLQLSAEMEALAAEEQIRITEQQYFEHYLGLDDAAFFLAVLADHGMPRARDQIGHLLRRKVEVYLGYLDQGIRLFPGVEALVRQLAERYPMAICSGAPRKEIEAVLALADLASCFGEVVTFEDVERGKPDPTIFLEGMRRLRPRESALEAAGCLVIEDSPRGVEAAVSAGMTCLAVTNSAETADLTAAGARQVVGSLEQVSAGDLRGLVG